MADLKYEYFIEEMINCLVETDTSFATNMELAIVETWNGDPLTVQKELAVPASNVVKFLKKQKVTGAAKHLGRGFDEPVTITPNWSKWGASNPTPKTDLMIGKYKFSLKTGPAQLMSGGKSETVATFMNSLEQVKVKAKGKKLVKQIEGSLNKFVEGGYTKKGTVKANLQTNKILKAGDNAHKEMMSILSEFFEVNSDFKNTFAQEAMSGEIKFGKKSPGFANYILVASKDGLSNKMKKTNDKSYVSAVADAMKVSVRFKSASEKRSIGGKQTKTGRYRFWSVVGLCVGHVEECFNQYKGDVLTEAILGDIWSKIKGFMTKLFKKVKAFLQGGVANVMEFLGIDEPDVNFNNNVDLTKI